MNKTELIAAVAEKASISKKESEVVINAALDTIIDSLKNDEKVQLVGFGSFETKHRAERTGRNPKTKESITIAASSQFGNLLQLMQSRQTLCGRPSLLISANPADLKNSGS